MKYSWFSVRFRIHLHLFPWSWRHRTSSIKDTRAPVECFCMSIENGQLFEFIITCWDSISYTSLMWHMRSACTQGKCFVIMLSFDNVRLGWIWQSAGRSLEFFPVLLHFVSNLKANADKEWQKLEGKMRYIHMFYNENYFCLKSNSSDNFIYHIIALECLFSVLYSCFIFYGVFWLFLACNRKY